MVVLGRRKSCSDLKGRSAYGHHEDGCVDRGTYSRSVLLSRQDLVECYRPIPFVVVQEICRESVE
jgi:hypothetical protein